MDDHEQVVSAICPEGSGRGARLRGAHWPVTDRFVQEARPEGFEPPTDRVETGCSIR